MKLNQKGQKNTWLLKCLVGLAVTCGSALVIAAIGAMLILDEKLSVGAMSVMAVAAQFTAVFLGVLCTGMLMKERKAVACFMVTLSYYFILLSVTVLLWGGQFEGIVPNILGGALGCGSAFLISIKQKTAKRRHRRKGYSR